MEMEVVYFSDTFVPDFTVTNPGKSQYVVARNFKSLEVSGSPNYSSRILPLRHG
jgi:hypothetical protein